MSYGLVRHFLTCEARTPAHGHLSHAAGGALSLIGTTLPLTSSCEGSGASCCVTRSATHGFYLIASAGLCMEIQTMRTFCWLSCLACKQYHTLFPALCSLSADSVPQSFSTSCYSSLLLSWARAGVNYTSSVAPPPMVNSFPAHPPLRRYLSVEVIDTTAPGQHPNTISRRIAVPTTAAGVLTRSLCTQTSINMPFAARLAATNEARPLQYLSVLHPQNGMRWVGSPHPSFPSIKKTAGLALRTARRSTLPA